MATLLGVLCLSLIGNAVWLLGTLDQNGLRDLWLEAASSPNVDLRIAALNALGRAGGDPVSRRALADGLKDEDARVRMASIHGLESSRGAARDMIPVLKKLQGNDPEPEVRAAAGETLETLRGQGSSRSGSLMAWGLWLAFLGGAATLGWFAWSRIATLMSHADGTSTNRRHL
jgi:HEAT repeat protein